MKVIKELGFICDNSIYVSLKNMSLKLKLSGSEVEKRYALDLLNKFDIRGINISDTNPIIEILIKEDVAILIIGRYALLASNFGAKLLKTSRANFEFRILLNTLRVGELVRNKISSNYFHISSNLKVGYNLNISE